MSRLDVEITARLDKPYDAEFKGNVATKSNGLVGPGVSFSMSKMNVFRGAETLSFQAYGSYEWMTGAQMKGKHNLLNSYEWGTSLNLTYPRLLLLGLGRHFNRRASTILSGVTVGDYCVVAANSVVCKDIEDYNVVGGNPAKFIKMRILKTINEGGRLISCRAASIERREAA